MTALEARLGRRLFRHGAQGYAVTADGQALLDRAGRMEAAAADVAQWQAAAAGPVRVRVSAGTWTAAALARDVASYWAPGDGWVPEFVHCDLDMDIARREIDIGIRNRRPAQGWLAGRRTARIRYAAYGRPGAEGWIGASADAARTPSAAWLAATHGDGIVTNVNDPRLAVALAQAGVGLVVLPTFMGDTSGLDRIGAPIEALEHDEWLVCHHESRHDPPIRAALDALGRHLGGRGRLETGAGAL